MSIGPTFELMSSAFLLGHDIFVNGGGEYPVASPLAYRPLAQSAILPLADPLAAWVQAGAAHVICAPRDPQMLGAAGHRGTCRYTGLRPRARGIAHPAETPRWPAGDGARAGRRRGGGCTADCSIVASGKRGHLDRRHYGSAGSAAAHDDVLEIPADHPRLGERRRYRGQRVRAAPPAPARFAERGRSCRGRRVARPARDARSYRDDDRQLIGPTGRRLRRWRVVQPVKPPGPSGHDAARATHRFRARGKQAGVCQRLRGKRRAREREAGVSRA